MNKVVLPNAVLLGEVEKLLSEGRQVVLMTKGSSMMPFIRGEKDSVTLEKRQTVGVGDIVLAQLRPGHYVLHRVKAVDGGSLTLHGDGNLAGDERCSVSDVAGTAVSIVLPSGRERECISESSKRAARAWNRLPKLARRIILKLYRMTIR